MQKMLLSFTKVSFKPKALGHIVYRRGFATSHKMEADSRDWI